MKYKTVETVPFKTHYILVHRYHKTKYGPFDSISEAKKYQYAHHVGWYTPFTDTVKLTDSEIKYLKYLRDVGRKPDFSHLDYQFCITDFLGDAIPFDEVKAASGGPVYRNHSWEARSAKWTNTARRLVKVKGDGKKIKSDWAYTEDNSYRFGRSVEYKNRAIGNSRYIRTQSERRANAAHEADYGPGMVRASRLGYHLPSVWDDPRCGLYDLQISWKHSTKRRKQWIPK